MEDFRAQGEAARRMASSGLYESDVETTYDAGAETDEESLTDNNAPTDGYFTNREHPQDRYFQNPSSEEREHKAHAAADKRARSSHSGRTPQATRAPEWPSATAPLLDAGPAQPPPDYAAATADRAPFSPAPNPSRAPDGPLERVAGDEEVTGITQLPQRRESEHMTGYGTMPNPPTSQHSDHTDERRWPFGTVGNPFVAGFPFGPHGGPLGMQGLPPDHPLVTRGLFGEHGFFGFGQHGQSMQDPRGEPVASGLRGGGRGERHRYHRDRRYSHDSHRSHHSHNRHSSHDSCTSHDSCSSHGTSRSHSSWSRDSSDSDGSKRRRHRDRDRGHGRRDRSFWSSRSSRDWRRDDSKSSIWRCCCSPLTYVKLINWLIVIAVVILIVVLGVATRAATKKDKTPTDGGEPGIADGFVPEHPTSAGCPFKHVSDPAKFTFPSLVNFTFQERILNRDLPKLGSRGRFSGRIKLGAAPSDQKEDILVWVSVATTSSLMTDEVRARVDDHSMELLAPRLEGESVERACMDIFILIQVRDRVELSALEISTWRFKVDDYRGAHEPWSDDRVNTANSTRIFAASGDVFASFLNSRETSIKTSSGQVRGMYGLQELLHFESKSGKVDVSVYPVQTSNVDSDLATLRVFTSSGDIHTSLNGLDSSFSDTVLPERDYHVIVETQSGKVSGQYVFASSGLFKTASGMIDVDLLPFSTDEAKLRTETLSGDTALNLRSPHGGDPWRLGDGTVLDRLRSSHQSESGKLELNYPVEWEGLAYLRSRTGQLSTWGQDVNIISDEKLPGYHQLVARKGPDEVTSISLKGDTMTGGIHLGFPKFA